jgi:hypothetical protein
MAWFFVPWALFLVAGALNGAGIGALCEGKRVEAVLAFGAVGAMYGVFGGFIPSAIIFGIAMLARITGD